MCKTIIIKKKIKEIKIYRITAYYNQSQRENNKIFSLIHIEIKPP